MSKKKKRRNINKDDIGYIYLDRKIIKHWVYRDKPFCAGLAWIDLLLIADHTTHIELWRNTPTEFKRGDVNYSFLELSERWGWSRTRVKRFLNNLQNEHMVDIKADNRRTIITIVNYGDYQYKSPRDDTPNETPNDTTDETPDVTPSVTPNDTPSDTHISNNNKYKGIEKEYSASPSADASASGDGKSDVSKDDVDPYGDPPDGWNDAWEKEFMANIKNNPNDTRKGWYDFWYDGKEKVE